MTTALVSSRTVALVAVKDIEDKFYGFWREPKIRTDRDAAIGLAWAYVEGWERGIVAAFSPIFGAGYSQAWLSATRALAEAVPPTYASVRGYLVGDCEFDWIVACHAALVVTTINDRIVRRRILP